MKSSCCIPFLLGGIFARKNEFFYDYMQKWRTCNLCSDDFSLSLFFFFYIIKSGAEEWQETCNLLKITSNKIKKLHVEKRLPHAFRSTQAHIMNVTYFHFFFFFRVLFQPIVYLGTCGSVNSRNVTFTISQSAGFLV